MMWKISLLRSRGASRDSKRRFYLFVIHLRFLFPLWNHSFPHFCIAFLDAYLYTHRLLLIGGLLR